MHGNGQIFYSVFLLLSFVLMSASQFSPEKIPKPERSEHMKAFEKQ
jgi:hypothetical protein